MKIPRPKKPKNTIKRLRLIADKLWFARQLKLYCEAGGGYATQVHHFFYKASYPHLRYDKDNGISLSKGKHFLLHTRDPKKVEALIIKARGKEWLKRLTYKANHPPKNFKTNVGYYKKVIEELK